MPARKPTKRSMKEFRERYDAAVEDLEQFRAAWDKLGRPEFERGSQMQLCQHPLIKMIRDAERSCTQLGQAAGVIPINRGGRPRGAASAPDRASKPKLRAVS